MMSFLLSTKPYVMFYFRKQQRRPSSDDISTPTSCRSRSSSLLSSDYIAEEDESLGLSNQPQSAPRKISSSSAEMTSNIDRLFDLVHELKEEDLKDHKRKIEQNRKKEGSSTSEEVVLDANKLAPTILDLNKVLVPTTTQMFNIMQDKTEICSMEFMEVPVPPLTVEKRKSDIVISKSPLEPLPALERSNSEPSSIIIASLNERADQLKKARQDFFLGNSTETVEKSHQEAKNEVISTADKVKQSAAPCQNSPFSLFFKSQLSQKLTDFLSGIQCLPSNQEVWRVNCCGSNNACK